MQNAQSTDQLLSLISPGNTGKQHLRATNPPATPETEASVASDIADQNAQPSEFAEMMMQESKEPEPKSTLSESASVEISPVPPRETSQPSAQSSQWPWVKGFSPQETADTQQVVSHVEGQTGPKIQGTLTDPHSHSQVPGTDPQISGERQPDSQTALPSEPRETGTTPGRHADQPTAVPAATAATKADIVGLAPKTSGQTKTETTHAVADLANSEKAPSSDIDQKQIASLSKFENPTNHPTAAGTDTAAKTQPAPSQTQPVTNQPVSAVHEQGSRQITNRPQEPRAFQEPGSTTPDPKSPVHGTLSHTLTPRQLPHNTSPEGAAQVVGTVGQNEMAKQQPGAGPARSNVDNQTPHQAHADQDQSPKLVIPQEVTRQRKTESPAQTTPRQETNAAQRGSLLTGQMLSVEQKSENTPVPLRNTPEPLPQSIVAKVSASTQSRENTLPGEPPRTVTQAPSLAAETQAPTLQALTAPDSVTEFANFVRSETTFTTSLTAPTQPVPQTAPDASSFLNVSRQLMEVANKHPDGPVELTLAPEELGRVRMNFSVQDGALTVSVATERSETLELMRRNIDALIREFREIGFSDVNLSFGKDDRNQGAANNPLAENSGDTDGLEARNAGQGSNDIQQISLTPTGDGGLDLRL